MTTPGIGTTHTIPIHDLNLHHKNPRRGDVDAIAGSLVANGQFRPIVVNKGTHTGRPNEVLAGNHTVKAIRQLATDHPDDSRWAHAEAYVIDVDEDRATRIVLADNRTADLGSYDDESLLDLLETIDHDLDGTGYDYDDLDMLRDLNDGAPSLDELEDEYADEASGQELQEEVGEDIALADVLWGEPEHQVFPRERYTLTTRGGQEHTLIIADLSEGHTVWGDYLEGRVFYPYPDPYLTLSVQAEERSMLLVQPNKFLAGHLLDKHASVHGEDTVVKEVGEDE